MFIFIANQTDWQISARHAPSSKVSTTLPPTNHGPPSVSLSQSRNYLCFPQPITDLPLLPSANHGPSYVSLSQSQTCVVLQPGGKGRGGGGILRTFLFLTCISLWQEEQLVRGWAPPIAGAGRWVALGSGSDFYGHGLYARSMPPPIIDFGGKQKCYSSTYILQWTINIMACSIRRKHIATYIQEWIVRRFWG